MEANNATARFPAPPTVTDPAPAPARARTSARYRHGGRAEGSQRLAIVAPGAFYAADAMLSRYHRAMLDDGGNDAPGLDPPDPQRVYANYLRSCRRLGVKPVPRERARKLIEEWTATLAASRSVPPVKH